MELPSKNRSYRVYRAARVGGIIAADASSSAAVTRRLLLAASAMGSSTRSKPRSAWSSDVELGAKAQPAGGAPPPPLAAEPASSPFSSSPASAGLGGAPRVVLLSWERVRLHISEGSRRRRRQRRALLDGVHGFAPPYECTAVLGPSGSG